MINKLVLTQELITRYPDAPDLDLAMRTWWQHRREDSGLRLTDVGYLVFDRHLELDSYSFELPEKFFTAANLLALDRHMNTPYYLVNNRKHHRLVMFGSREAMMATLYGDIQKFISSLTY
jgi:hypothetical protein